MSFPFVFPFPGHFLKQRLPPTSNFPSNNMQAPAIAPGIRLHTAFSTCLTRSQIRIHHLRKFILIL